MVELTQPVGRNAFADSHTVAVVQAAFKHIKVKTRTGMKPLWPGRIDGHKSAALEDAIVAFQMAQGLNPTGKLERFGPAKAKRDRAVPAHLRAMRGVPGTPVVAVPTISEAEMMRRAEEIAKKAPLPAALARSLSRLAADLADKAGISLDIAKEKVSADGRFAITLGVTGSDFLDSLTGKALPASLPPPRPVIEMIVAAFRKDSLWREGAGNTLDIASAMQVAALKGPAELDRDGLKALGLSQMPKSNIVTACAAGAVKLAGSGRAGTADGKRQGAILVSAAHGADNTAAKAIDFILREDRSFFGRLFVDLSENQFAIIEKRISHALDLLDIRLDALARFDDAERAHFEDWFRFANDERRATVERNLRAVRDFLLGAARSDFRDSSRANIGFVPTGTTAFVLKYQTPIYLRPLFFRRSLQKRAGTLIHEALHIDHGGAGRFDDIDKAFRDMNSSEVLFSPRVYAHYVTDAP